MAWGELNWKNTRQLQNRKREESCEKAIGYWYNYIHEKLNKHSKLDTSFVSVLVVYVKICCCNFDSNTSQTCFQPSPVGDLVTIIRSSLPIQKHHLNDSKCWKSRLCIKSPHSPKPHVHPVKVYHGIRSFWNYLGANSGYFQQPPCRSLDHPINLPFPIFLGWKGWTGVIKHKRLYMFQRAHIDQSKND